MSSQFEQQVRALCGLPLGGTDLVTPAAMVNLLGDLWAHGEPDWEAALRSRPGRQAPPLRQAHPRPRPQDGPPDRPRPRPRDRPGPRPGGTAGPDPQELSVNELRNSDVVAPRNRTSRGWLGSSRPRPAQPPDGMPRHSVLGACPPGYDPRHPRLALEPQAVENQFLSSLTDRCRCFLFGFRLPLGFRAFGFRAFPQGGSS